MNKLILIILVTSFAICSKSWAEDNYDGMQCYHPETKQNSQMYFKWQKRKKNPEIFAAQIFDYTKEGEEKWEKFCFNYERDEEWVEDTLEDRYFTMVTITTSEIKYNKDSVICMSEMIRKERNKQQVYGKCNLETNLDYINHSFNTSGTCDGKPVEFNTICNQINIVEKKPLSGELDNKGLACMGNPENMDTEYMDKNAPEFIGYWFNKGLVSFYVFGKPENSEDYITMNLSNEINSGLSRCDWCYPEYSTNINTIEFQNINSQDKWWRKNRIGKEYWRVNRQNLLIELMREDKVLTSLNCELVTKEKDMSKTFKSLLNNYKKKNKI